LAQAGAVVGTRLRFPGIPGSLLQGVLRPRPSPGQQRKVMKRGGESLLLVLWLAVACPAAVGEEVKHAPRHHIRHAPPGLEGLDSTKGLSPRVVQRKVEEMAMRADKLAGKDEEGASKVHVELEDVEAALATRAGDDTALAEEIRAVRAELCSKRGFRSHRSADCEAFMRTSCFPDSQGIDDTEAAAPNSPTVPVALCKQFFSTEKAAAAPAAAPGPALAGAPSPSPGPAALAPEAAQFRDLPEQGFDGDFVGHLDQTTQTSDWQREFGPDAGHRTYREICKDRPNNRWCRLHLAYKGNLGQGWGPRPQKSGAAAHFGSGGVVVLLAAAGAAVALLGAGSEA